MVDFFLRTTVSLNMQYFDIAKGRKLKNKQDTKDNLTYQGLTELYLWCWHLTDISDVIFPPKHEYLNLNNI